MMADDPQRQTITGPFAFVPNPCTTAPCLPGMACAVEAGGRCYFLTVDGQWSDRAPVVNEWTPAIGQVISVVGRVTLRTDIRGDPFLAIEVETMRPAR